MPRWLPRLLRRIRDLAARGQVHLTLKARHELAALEAGLDSRDVRDVLIALTAGDLTERLESEGTGEWMYVFKPTIAATIVYLKVVVRGECVVVSFHEDAGEVDEEP